MLPGDRHPTTWRMQLSDQDNLGDFLESAGVPATDTTPAPDTSTPPTDLSRDPETGRFAPKQGDEPTVQDTPVEAARRCTAGFSNRPCAFSLRPINAYGGNRVPYMAGAVIKE